MTSGQPYPSLFRSLSTKAGAGLLLILLLLQGCSSSFQVKNLAKTDVDMVADHYISQQAEYVQLLTSKLYKRNPRELRKNPGMSIEQRLAQLNGDPSEFEFSELGNGFGNDLIRMAFSENYEGDRVFALLVGIRTTLHAAYGHRTELFLLDELDEQRLYNSARNLEIIAWRLNNMKDDKGELFLLSNGYQDGIANLSYERLFGKMIGLQDMMARIVADKNDRTLNTVFHSVATSALFPLGL